MDIIRLIKSPDLVVLSSNVVRNPNISLGAVGLYAKMVSGGKKEYTRDNILWFCKGDEKLMESLIKELRMIESIASQIEVKGEPEPTFL